MSKIHSILDRRTHDMVFLPYSSLKIYGRPGCRDQLEPMLKWATPGGKGFTDAMRRNTIGGGSQSLTTGVGASQSAVNPSGYTGIATQSYASSSQQSSAALAEQRARQEAQRQAYMKAEELKNIIKSFETVDDDSRRSSLLDSLCSNEDILNLPLEENPPSKETKEMRTNLMKHQRQALKWMLAMENPVLPKSTSDPPVQVRSCLNSIAQISELRLIHSGGYYILVLEVR